MKIIKVNLKERSYDIVIGNNLIDSLPKILKKINIGKDAFIITNGFLKRKFAVSIARKLVKKGFHADIFVVPDSEQAKSPKVFFSLISKISAADKSKEAFIITIGGGVVGDLGGFIASVYKRGIPYVQIPTTLLGQIDSGIGGKTAVNLDKGKNLLGAFYQPKLVLNDVRFLVSLSKEDFSSGLAEAVKYAVIKDAKLFGYLEDNADKIMNKDNLALIHLISACAKIKADVVSRDEREKKNLRTILNFGHTIGHAIETASRFKKIRHGEAVGIGMLCAADLSCYLSLFSRDNTMQIESLLNKFMLPTRIRGLKLCDIIKAHYSDKKFKGRINKFVLPVAIGKVIIKERIPLSLIKKAVRGRLV